MKELQPAYNRQLQRPEGLCGFVFDGTRLRLADHDEIDAESLPLMRGLFRSRRAANSALRHLADEDGLCLQTLGFNEGFSSTRKGSCFRHQIARCRGVCAGKENPHFHLARVAAALARFPGAEAWPHAGPVGIVERRRGDDDDDGSEVHVIDRWCYLGTASCDAEVGELLSSRRRPFDYDHYRILARHLGRRGVRAVPIGR